MNYTTKKFIYVNIVYSVLNSGVKMPNITVSISEELKKKMDALKVINWSEVAREAFAKRVELTEGYEKFQEIVFKSKLTDKDVKELTGKVNKSMHERLKKLYPSLK